MLEATVASGNHDGIRIIFALYPDLKGEAERGACDYMREGILWGQDGQLLSNACEMGM